jgi:hypothetical protein
MGCVVIHLPLHHYELNPIDLLWAWTLHKIELHKSKNKRCGASNLASVRLCETGESAV